MTASSSANRDNKAAQGKRNKKTDSYGNPYDQRSGKWGDYDRAIDEEQCLYADWLTPERCDAELSILNYPGKPGKPYVYPPSLIMFVLMHKEGDGKSFRQCPGHCRGRLKALGLPVPCYKTIHGSSVKFFHGGLGAPVMEAASAILREKGVVEPLDPVVFVGSGVLPEYQAPQKIPVCQKDVDEQALKDKEAEILRDSMEVFVYKKDIESGLPVECAVDGSGEGTTCTGIYMEHIWKVNDRHFIKQHAMLNLQTQEVTAFSITLESPGDAKVLAPLARGAVAMGVRLAGVVADSAYDTKENWTAMESLGVDFNPNLKADFKNDADIASRRSLRLMEEKLGKTIAHRVTGYTIRWLVESFFSAIKRLYGDKVRARVFAHMAVIMRIRYTLYNIHRGLILKHVS